MKQMIIDSIKDDYKVKRYEFIGTIWVSIVISSVIVGLIVSWSV